MLTVLFQALLLAAGGIFSFGSMTVVILLLLSHGGLKNGLGFVLGYLFIYTIIGMGSIIIGTEIGLESHSEEPDLARAIVFIILGTLLFIIALRNLLRPKDSEDNNKTPRLFSIFDEMTALKAFAFGSFVSVLNFKNLAIFLSAISVLYMSNLERSIKLIFVLPVVLIFCLSVIIPLLIYLLFWKKAEEILGRIKRTLEGHSRIIGIIVPIVFGIYFIINGIRELL